MSDVKFGFHFVKKTGFQLFWKLFRLGQKILLGILDIVSDSWEFC